MRRSDELAVSSRGATWVELLALDDELQLLPIETLSSIPPPCDVLTPFPWEAEMIKYGA